MDRWFDLHLYLASWGTRRLMIRFPRQRLDISRLDGFLRAADDFASLKASEDHVALDIRREEQEDQFERDDRSWLASLAPLRAAVMSGDLRLFYMVWLSGVDGEFLDDEAEEPLHGTGPLTPALDAFATFFGIDADLVAAAAERSPNLSPVSLRSVGALRVRAEAVRSARGRADDDPREEERRRLAAEHERARRARLVATSRRGAAVWREVDQEIERRNATGYDKAAALLMDLAILAEEQGATQAFGRRLSEIRARHAAKKRFIERLTTRAS